jgi:hypothetical protein
MQASVIVLELVLVLDAMDGSRLLVPRALLATPLHAAFPDPSQFQIKNRERGRFGCRYATLGTG